MKKLMSVEKMKIIEEATKKQLLEFKELHKTGVIEKHELESFERLIVDVFKIQKITIGA